MFYVRKHVSDLQKPNPKPLNRLPDSFDEFLNIQPKGTDLQKSPKGDIIYGDNPLLNPIDGTGPPDDEFTLPDNFDPRPDLWIRPKT